MNIAPKYTKQSYSYNMYCCSEKSGANGFEPIVEFGGNSASDD